MVGRAHLATLIRLPPGKMLAKGIYENRNGHLLSDSNRVWYEADIDYTSGYRGISRKFDYLIIYIDRCLNTKGNDAAWLGVSDIDIVY